jgi:hypothetical protein
VDPVSLTAVELFRWPHDHVGALVWDQCLVPFFHFFLFFYVTL